MLLSLLRSVFRQAPAPAAPAAPTSDSGPAPSWAAQVSGQIEGLSHRVDEIRAHMAQMHQLAYWRYQSEAAGFLARILSDSRYDDPLRLERFGFKVYSQNEEDGILAEIFRRIGPANMRFLEFGVGNGLENNTLCLLEQGWSGAWLESSSDRISAIEKGFARHIGAGRLKVREAIVGRDNINDLVRVLALPRVSIDIDGNDYHVWEALTAIDPRVVVIEYNAKFRPPMKWVMDYDPSHSWDGTDQFGASLEAVAGLGQKKGYRLVACNITGTNAFFVKSELAQNGFVSPSDAASLYQPARYFLTVAFVSGHPAGYSRAAGT